MQDKRTKICLWSTPRSISTAMMYSFAQRPDTIVFDEPLSAHHIKVTEGTHEMHLSRDETLATQCNDGEAVVRDIILADHDKPISFHKNQTSHLQGLNPDFLTKTTNVILIRDPRQTIGSNAVNRPNVGMDIIGIDKQWELFGALSAAGKPPIVVDSNEVLKDPRKVIGMLCDALGIPFYEQMLRWEAGGRPEDGCWAKYWYGNLHKSTGFQKQVTSDRPFPDHLLPLLQECQSYYHRLYAHSLKA